MAFNFPDPAVETTVTNTVTGATYQWKADPGKWVLAGGAPPAPDTYFPFTSSYTLVHPDKYTEADGTCTAETDAYVNDPDINFNSPYIKKWRFAPKDLNGQPLTNISGNIKYFDYTQYPRHTNTESAIQYATFETTTRVGYQDWEGNVAFSRYLNLTEDAEVHIRYPSQAEEAGSYVKKSGDTMIGDLVMDDANILIEDGSLIFNRTGTDVELQDEENRFSKIKSVAPYDIDTGTLDYSSKFGIKVDLDGGNSFKNNFKVGNRHGDIVRITGGAGAQIEFATSGFTPNADNTGLTSGIAIRHIPTPSFEDSPGDLAVNKEYVDARDEILQQEIIELEEEIDAIAPSTERGTWAYNPVGNVAAPGAYTMYTDTRDDGLGGVASIFAAVKNIALNERDLNNTVHSFGGTEPGDLLEIFEEGDADYGLYSIISIEKLSNPNPGGIAYTYISIDVDLERTGNGDKAETRARFKVFKAPTGGDASGFVLKTGDTMSGDLDIDVSEKSNDIEAALILKGNRPSTTNSSATIKFDNEQSTEKGYLTYRAMNTSAYFSFNQNVDLKNNGLHSVGQIRMQPGLNYIGSGSAARIKINNGSSSQAGTEIQRVGDTKRAFAIKGKAAGSTDITDFFWAYGNSGTGGDAINYTGRMTSDTNIVTKAYVDSKVGGIDIDCNASGRSKGEMWYCSSDQVLYIKVS